MIRNEVTWTIEWAGGNTDKRVASYGRINGALNGRYREYDAEGALCEEGAFENGKRVDSWTEYFSNGQVKAVKQYKNGELNGLRTVFFLGGGLSHIEYWRDGKCVGLENLTRYNG